jgi:hypothetical protein
MDEYFPLSREGLFEFGQAYHIPTNVCRLEILQDLQLKIHSTKCILMQSIRLDVSLPGSLLNNYGYLYIYT